MSQVGVKHWKKPLLGLIKHLKYLSCYRLSTDQSENAF